MPTSLTTADQMESLASAIKAYTDAKQQETIAIVIAAVQQAGSSSATEPELLDPELSVSPTTLPYTGGTVQVSYLGNGTITFDTGTIDYYSGSITYNATTRTFTVPPLGQADSGGTVTVSLSASEGYTAATATFDVEPYTPTVKL